MILRSNLQRGEKKSQHQLSKATMFKISSTEMSLSSSKPSPGALLLPVTQTLKWTSTAKLWGALDHRRMKGFKAYLYHHSNNGQKSLTNNKLSWQETFPRNWCPVWNETLPAFQCMLQGKSTGSNRPMELHNNLYKPWIGTLEHQAPNASVIRAPTNLSCHNRHCWLNSKSSSAYRVRNPQGHQDLCIKKKPHKTKAQEGKFENLWC